MKAITKTKYETSRLLVEKLEKTHLEYLVDFYSKIEIMKYVNYGRVWPKEEVESWLNKKIRFWKDQGYGSYVFHDKNTGAFIGRGGLSTWDHTGRVELGFAFYPEYWGKGFATEVGRSFVEIGFGELKLKELYGTVRKENIPSQKVLEKLGMRLVGEEPYMELPALVYKVAVK
jgi:ribosomal-protein-alanine N-acetyltransferase